MRVSLPQTLPSDDTDRAGKASEQDLSALFDVEKAQSVLLESPRPHVLDAFFESAKIVDTTPGSYKCLVRNPNKNTGNT